MNTISLYAIMRDSDNKFFGGFDPTKGEAIIVDDVIQAKLFSNKFDINLRPDEKMVEVMITMTHENTRVTNAFKPRRRVDRLEGSAPRVGATGATDARRITD